MYRLCLFQIPQSSSTSLSSSTLRRSSCHEFFLDREYHDELVPATQRILDREKDRMNHDLVSSNRKISDLEIANKKLMVEISKYRKVRWFFLLVLVCTFLYWFVLVCTGLYLFVLVCTIMFYWFVISPKRCFS